MSESNHVTSTKGLGSAGGLDSAQHHDLLLVLEHLVTSSEPAIVLSSLAELCVPAFSDGCTVELFQDEAAAYRVSYPAGSSDGSPDHEPDPCLGPSPTAALSAPGEIRTLIDAPEVADYPPYSGTLIHTWTGPAPSADCAAIARLLVDLAVAGIQRQRLADRLQQAQDAVANLLMAVATNRQIGAAVGILMVNHKITDEQAFERLRVASQRAHRKLRDIAADVTRTGFLEPPPLPARAGRSLERAAHR